MSTHVTQCEQMAVIIKELESLNDQIQKLSGRMTVLEKHSRRPCARRLQNDIISALCKRYSQFAVDMQRATGNICRAVADHLNDRLSDDDDEDHRPEAVADGNSTSDESAIFVESGPLNDADLMESDEEEVDDEEECEDIDDEKGGSDESEDPTKEEKCKYVEDEGEEEEDDAEKTMALSPSNPYRCHTRSGSYEAIEHEYYD